MPLYDTFVMKSLEDNNEKKYISRALVLLVFYIKKQAQRSSVVCPSF